MNNVTSDGLKMKFDPRTIEHLGIQMYSTLPPVLGELVSNAYDAEAEQVEISFFDLDPSSKRIEVSDNGIGMSYNEINDKFLIIGRNRREDEKSEWSKNKKRLVIGKKGLGKLAFFGIATHIRIITIQNYKATTFELDWADIKRSDPTQNEYYRPSLIGRNEPAKQEKGTKIILTGISRKSAFLPEQIAHSIAKSFQVLNQSDFGVYLSHNEGPSLKVTNEMRYDGIDPFCVWNLPEDMSSEIKGIFEEHAMEIKGKLISSQETVSSDMNGIALFSRGKLVNNYSFLDVKASSHGYSYITGWLDVSYIELLGKEVIATNRQSLNWELDETADLKIFLEILYRAFFNHQKNEREEAKKNEVTKNMSIDLDEWYDTLPRHERKLAKKMVSAIISSEGIEISKAADLIKFTQDSFQFESFKELAYDLDDMGFENKDKVISFFQEWKLVEAKEMYKIACVRVETIKKFREHIKLNSREVPEIHNFLRQFPWLLDPRLMNFKDEVTYSSLLKEHFPEGDDILESDKRIDFLCQDFAGTFFIIELKRPRRKIGVKELEQAVDYSSFIKEKITKEYPTNVLCYIIGDSLLDDPSVRTFANALQASGNVIFRPYENLLNSAINYHQEFIDQYEKTNKNINLFKK